MKCPVIGADARGAVGIEVGLCCKVKVLNDRHVLLRPAVMGRGDASRGEDVGNQ